MADDVVPFFQNDAGSAEIKIGVTKFTCCGASAPFDHPHVFLDLDNENEIVCPYCSTLYKYSKSLKPNETLPSGCLFEVSAA
jgi:uncharacterized Zn-finger protein